MFFVSCSDMGWEKVLRAVYARTHSKFRRDYEWKWHKMISMYSFFCGTKIVFVASCVRIKWLHCTEFQSSQVVSDVAEGLDNFSSSICKVTRIDMLYHVSTHKPGIVILRHYSFSPRPELVSIWL